MNKKLVTILGAVLFGAMFVIGLIIMSTVSDRTFVIPTPERAVVGGVLAMFATLGYFALGFVHAATVE